MCRDMDICKKNFLLQKNTAFYKCNYWFIC